MVSKGKGDDLLERKSVFGKTEQTDQQEHIEKRGNSGQLDRGIFNHDDKEVAFRINDDIHNRLLQLAEPGYQKFSSNLLPTVDDMLGVRLPKLRVIAKELAKKDYKLYLEYARDDSFEEVMLQGMTIGYVKSSLAELIPYIKRFIPKINNWSVCDSFCSGLKIASREPDLMWNFLLFYVYSKKEFEVRFAVVMMLNYFVNERYIEKSLVIFNEISQKGYYAKMAVAWAISMYFIMNPERVLRFLQECDLDEFTYNKAIRKICESKVVTTDYKNIIKDLRKI